MKYANTDAETRRWLTLQHPDGHTLELAPGETVELKEEIDDPYLKPVKPAKGKTPEKPAEAPQED